MKRVSGILIVATLFALADNVIADREMPIPLSTAAMEVTRGGVLTNGFSYPMQDNFPQGQDNLGFVFDVINGNTNDGILVALFSGSQKYGEAYLAPSSKRTYRWSAKDWPIDTVKRDVEIMVSGEGGWVNPLGEAVRYNNSIAAQLKVAKVRFYFLQEPGGTQKVSIAPDEVELVDNTTYPYNWRTTSSVDAINLQCAMPRRWNYRAAGSSRNITVPDGCTRILSGGNRPRCNDWVTVMDNMVAQQAALGSYDEDDYVHVIFVNSFELWDSTVGDYRSFIGYYPGGNRKWFLVDGSISASQMSTTIAHEIGHAQGLCHVDDPSCAQSPGSNHGCNVSSGSERNLMCSGVGRQLSDATQCSVMGASTRFKDWL